MIHTERKVTVKTENCTVDIPIILYRGDGGIEINFEILDNRFKFTSTMNYIQNSQASYGQLVIKNPNGTSTFSEVNRCKSGKVILTITKSMIDEIEEVGAYSFQIRLFDEEQTSRITLPPIVSGIIIKEPIASEDNN